MDGEFVNGMMVGAVIGAVFCCVVFLGAVLLMGKSLKKSAYKCGDERPEGGAYEQWVP